MNAFLDGRESRFASILSSASTEHIHELNRYLLAVVGNLRHGPEALAVSPSCSVASEPLEGNWSALSSSDLAAMKAQIDQQLNTVRTEFQAFFGPLTHDMVAAAAVELDSLPILALISGAKNNTSRLMALLSAQQDSESSLVDEVLFSMSQLMDSESLVTANDPLEGLMEALQLESLQSRALLDSVTADASGHAGLAPAPQAAKSGPQSFDDVHS